MFLLNFFQHSDGSFAWDNLLLLALALLAGYLLHRFRAKKNVDSKYAKDIVAGAEKYKQLENEYKNYKSNILSSEKQNEKSLVQLGGRVKSLEGDIRTLADEKNKLHQQLISKEEEIKQYMRQFGDQEDNLKALQASKIKTDGEWTEKLKLMKEELTRAAAWELRVKAAEEEAQKARAGLGAAERKKLEAELRLNATTAYAGKVVPLENELKSVKEKYAVLENESSGTLTILADLEAKFNDAAAQLKAMENEYNSLKQELSAKDKLITDSQEKAHPSKELVDELKIARAQLELQKENNSTLQQEFEMKHDSNIALGNEIDYLKTTLRKLAAENEMLKSKPVPDIFSGTDKTVANESTEAADL